MVTPEAYHKEVGGRKREDNRKKYEHTDYPRALIVRSLIVELRKKTGMPIQDLATHLGTSRSTMTLISQRRAGDKIRPEGKSTTDIIFERIEYLLSHINSAEDIYFPPLFTVKRQRLNKK